MHVCAFDNGQHETMVLPLVVVLPLERHAVLAGGASARNQVVDKPLHHFHHGCTTPQVCCIQTPPRPSHPTHVFLAKDVQPTPVIAKRDLLCHGERLQVWKAPRLDRACERLAQLQ